MIALVLVLLVLVGIPLAFGTVKNVWIAVDQLGNAYFKGYPDETLSSRAWRWELCGKRAWPRKLIDCLLFFDADHCRESYQSELERSQSPAIWDKPLPPEPEAAKNLAVGDAWKTPGGVKHDAGKLRLDLISPEMLRALGEVLTFGANKYGDRNWEKGIDLARLYAANQRHLLAHREGEITDPESGMPHLYHAFCSLGMMLTLYQRSRCREKDPETTVLQ